jgi:electron transfer flavoprotein alpha subunit
MAVLVIADHDNKTVRDSTHKTVTAAAKLSSDIDILVLGHGARAAADHAAKITGVRKVLLAESDQLGQMIAEAVEACVVPLMGSYDALLVPASSNGKNFTPRIAAKLDVAQITDVVEVVDDKTFTRPIYAGNALETIVSSDAKKVITVRPTVFKAAEETGSASVEKADAGPGFARTRFVGEEVVKSARPELGAAKIVVSGAAPWALRKSSIRSSNRWPTSSGPPSAPLAPPSTPATPPTTTRSDRPARSWPRTSTSPSASPAPSSTSPA